MIAYAVLRFRLFYVPLNLVLACDHSSWYLSNTARCTSILDNQETDSRAGNKNNRCERKFTKTANSLVLSSRPNYFHQWLSYHVMALETRRYIMVACGTILWCKVKSYTHSSHTYRMMQLGLVLYIPSSPPPLGWGASAPQQFLSVYSCRPSRNSSPRSCLLIVLHCCVLTQVLFLDCKFSPEVFVTRNGVCRIEFLV